MRDIMVNKMPFLRVVRFGVENGFFDEEKPQQLIRELAEMTVHFAQEFYGSTYKAINLKKSADAILHVCNLAVTLSKTDKEVYQLINSGGVVKLFQVGFGALREFFVRDYNKAQMLKYIEIVSEVNNGVWHGFDKYQQQLTKANQKKLEAAFLEYIAKRSRISTLNELKKFKILKTCIMSMLIFSEPKGVLTFEEFLQALGVAGKDIDKLDKFVLSVPDKFRQLASEKVEEVKKDILRFIDADNNSADQEIFGTEFNIRNYHEEVVNLCGRT